MDEEWEHIADVGISSIRHYRRIGRDHILMVALIDRWDSVTNTFHLPTGEMTVTLED
ncbi:hypothetical protein KI387_039613, partial [Taxus chinensis]